MRSASFLLAIMALLLLPAFSFAVVVDPEEQERYYDEYSDWATFYQDDTPQRPEAGLVEDRLGIRIEVEYPSTYIPEEGQPEIIIKTYSPLLTNCFFYVQVPDGRDYDTLSVRENQSLRDDISSDGRKTREQVFTVSIPQFYLRNEIRFYVHAINSIGREANYRGPQNPVVIRVAERERAISMGTQLFIVLITLVFGLVIFKASRRGDEARPKRKRSSSRKKRTQRPGTYKKPKLPPPKDKLL